MGENILSVNGLTKFYGKKVAVDNVSFEVWRGEIVGLVGPNGAGKTTTINMILGILTPSSGTIFVAGMNIADKRSTVLNLMNFSAVYAPLPGNLTVFENLYIFSLLYGVKNIKSRINQELERFKLTDFRNTKCGVLSSGEQTRVSLAKALLNEPQLLLLDEPTASLDPSVAEDIRMCIREYACQKKCGVLWTSHNMLEVEKVCDRVLLLSSGRIFLEGNPTMLPRKYGKVNLEELFISVARQPLSF